MYLTLYSFLGSLISSFVHVIGTWLKYYAFILRLGSHVYEVCEVVEHMNIKSVRFYHDRRKA